MAPEWLILVCIAHGKQAFLNFALFAATYMGIKVNIVYNRAKLAVAAFWNVGLAANAHGQPASPEDLMEAGAVCSICQVSHRSSLITSHLPQSQSPDCGWGRPVEQRSGGLQVSHIQQCNTAASSTT